MSTGSGTMPVRLLPARAGLLLAMLLAVNGAAKADYALPVARPAYCQDLAWIVKNWQSARRDEEVRVRSLALARRLAAVARAAEGAGRYDVAKALILSSRWVAAGAGANHAAQAREFDVGKRMWGAGRAANPTIRTDCGFTPYPKPPPP
jgi:type IV pilus biogenesis protein CpaD/CtpE